MLALVPILCPASEAHTPRGTTVGARRHFHTNRLPSIRQPLSRSKKLQWRSAIPRQTNNNAMPGRHLVLTEDHTKLSPSSIAVNSINSLPSHRFDQPCTCIHCRYMGPNRVRTLSPATVRSPDPTITDLYQAKSFTLSPELSPREIFSDSLEVPPSIPGRVPILGGTWAWDTRYVPYQYPEAPWLPSGKLSSLYVKQFTCCRCGKKKRITDRRVGSPGEMPCCRSVLQKRRHKRYAFLHSDAAKMEGNWLFQPREKIPERFPDDDCAGHCQLMPRNAFTIGDSSTEWRRAKSVELTGGNTPARPASEQKISSSNYFLKGGRLFGTPVPFSLFERDMPPKDPETKISRSTSPIQGSRDAKSVIRPKPCPRNLVLPVLSPPHGPTDEQMHRYLRRHCHQRVIAFNDADGIFYPGLIQKCVAPESSIVRFRHNGTLLEVPNQLTLPVVDMLHTQSLNVGDTALVRVKNLNAACECWVPARIVGGFLGSPDPRYPLRHRYKLRLFSGAKHVFRRRDILRISPLFYKSLIEYIKTKRGIEEPESPTASGEGKPRPIRKRRKRVHPEPEPPLVPRPKQRRRIYKKEVKPPSPQPKVTPKAADSLIPKPMPRRAPEKREKPTTQSPERVVPMATPQKSVVASKPPEIPARAPRVATRPPAPVVPPQPPPRPVLPRPEFPREPTKKVLKEEPKPPTATAVPNKMKAKKTPVKRVKKPFTQAKMPYGKALHGDQKTTQVSSRVSSVDPTAIEALLVLAEEVHHQTTNDLGDEVLPQRLDQTDYDQSKEVEAMQTPEETENTVSIREESVHEAQEEDLWGTDSLNLESEQHPSVQSVLEEFENMDIINPYVDNMDTGELLAPPAGETLSYGAQVLSKEADRSLTDIPTEPLSEVHEPPVAVSVEIEEPLVKDGMPEPQAVFMHIDRDPEVVYEIEDELTESTKSAIEPITRTTVPQQEYIATDEEPVGEEIYRITEGKSDALEVPSKRIPDGYHEQVQDTTVSHLNQELVGSAASVSSSLDSADLSEERSVPLYEAPQIKPHVPVEKDRTEDQRGASKLRELGPDDRSKEGLSSRMAQVSTAKPPLPSRLHGQPTKTTPVSNYAKEEKVSAKTLRKQLQDADSERTATPVGGEVRSMEVLAESKGSVETVSKQQKNAHLKRAAASKSPQRAAVREQSKKRMHDGTRISDSSSVTHLSSVSSEVPDYVEDVTQGGTQVVVINLSDTNEFPQQRLAQDNVFSEQLYDEAVKSKTSGTISPHGLLELHQSAESVADHVTRLDSIDDETGARTQFTPKETAGSVPKLPPNRREDLSSESMARSTTIPQYLSEPEAPKEHYTHDETGVQQITGKVTQEDIKQFEAPQQVKSAGIPLDGEPGELGIDTATAIAIARTGSMEKRRPGEEIPMQPPEDSIDKDRSMQHETKMISESKWAKEPQVVRSDHEPKIEEPLIRKLDDIDSSKVHTEQERELKYQQAMYQKDDQHTAESRVFGTAPVSVESEDRQRSEALATKSDDTTGYLRAPAESVTSGQSLIAQRIPQVPDVATVKERSEGEQLVLPTGEVVRGSVEAGREPVPPYDEAHRMAIEPGIAEGGTFGTAPLSVESDYRQRSEALATKSDDTTGYLRAPAESVTSGQSLIAQRIPQVPDVATVKERSEGEQLVLPTGEVVRGSVEAGREPVPPYDEAHRMAIEPGIAEGGTFGTAPLSMESDYRQRSEALATKSDDTTGYLRAPAESVTSGQSLIAQRIPQVPDVATVKERSEGEQLVLPTGEVVRGSVEAGREPVPPYDEAHRMAIEPGIAEGGTFGTAPLSVESDYRQRSEALATKSDDTTGYLRAPAESVTSGQSLIAQRIPQVPDVATVKERSEGEQLVLPTGEVVRGSVEAGREPVPPYDEAHRMAIEPGIAEGGTFGTAPLSVESDYRQRSEALATKSDDTTGYLRAPAESVTSGQSLIAQRIPQVPDVATVKERSEGEQLVLPTGEVVRGSVEAGREPVPPYDETHRMAIEPGIAEGGTFGTAPLSVESDYRQRSEALATKSDDTTGYLRAPAESVTSGQSLIAQRIPQVPDVATVKERSEGEQLVLPTGEVVRGSVEAGREPVPPYDEAHRMAIEPGIAEGGTFGTAPLSMESDYCQRSEALATKSDDTTGYLRAPAESVTSGQSLIAQRTPQVPDVATVKERSEGEQLVLPTGEVVRGSVEAGREPVPPYDEAHRMAIEPGIAEGGTFGTAPLSVESDYRQRSEALATKSDDTTGYLRAPAESVTSGQSLIAQRIPQVPDVATVKERSEGEQLVLPTGEVVRGSVEAGREPVPSYDEASRMGIEQQIAEHGSISALSSSAPGEILPKSSLTTPVGIMYLPSPKVSSSSPVFEQSFGKVHQDKISLLDRASGRSLIYSDGEHSRNETTRDGRVWETCMKTADIPFYVDLPSHDSFGESEAAKSRVCEETDAEYVSKEASEQHMLMHTTRESDERRLSSTGFHTDQLTDFSPGTSRPSPEGIRSDLPTHLAEAKPFSHERLFSAMSHVAFSRDDDGGIKYQSQSVVEIGKYEPVIGQPTLTGARSVEYRDENFQFEVPLPKERASEDNKPGKAAPFEPTIDAISSLKPSICDVHADLTVYPDSAKHPWRNAKQIVQPDLKHDTGPFADSPSMSKTHEGQTAIKSATRMSFPSPSPVDYVSGVHSGSPSPIQLIPVTSRPCSAMSIRSTIHTELTLGSDRLAPPLVSSITTLQLDSPQYGYSLSATHENVKRAHSHESSLNKITLPNPPFCPYRHNELLVNSDHSIKSDMVPPKRIWGNIDSNMRGKRGQIAKITTHTTLSDTGPCLGLVSRLSTEIIFVPEGIVINTLSSSAQMLTDQIRKYHSATPVQLDAKAEPGTPKQLGLKTVTGGSPESAVYVNNDQVEKNVVRVLRDVSTVEVEGMESLTMDTLMISREIAIASNQECELEWSGLDSGTLGTVPCVTEQPDRRSSSKFPTSLQSSVENEARTSPQLVPTTYSQAEAAYRQKIEAEYFPASRKSLEQQWNLDSSSLVGSTSRSRAARQGRELSQEWKTLESEGDSKMTSFLLTSTIDILCQSEPSDPHSSASKLVQERPAQQKVSRSEFTRPDDASHPANAFTDPLVLPKFHPIQLANEPTHGVVALPIDKDMGTFESKYEVQFKPDAKPCKIPGGKLTTYLKANQTCGTRSSPTKPLRWRSEASLAQPRFACCICHAQRCTCLSTTRSRGYHRSGPISTVTGTRSIPLHGLVSDGETTKTGRLNLAVSVIHADVGELEVITQVEVCTNDKLPWSGQPTRPPAPLEIRSQVGSPQTSPRIAFPRDSLGESTAAPKSVTLNMSSTTKIDLTHTSATGKKAISEVTQPSTHSSQADRKDMESIPPPVEFAITSAHDQPTADELMTEQHSYTQSNDTRSCDATECAGRINSPGQPANMEDNNANRNVFSRSSWYDQRYPAYTHGPGDNGARTTETEASSPVFIPVDGNNCGASEAYSSSESKSRHCEGARTNTTALITVLDESNSNVDGTLSLVHQDHQKNAAVASTSATQPLGASREEGGDTSCLDYSDTESTEENEGPSLSTRAVRLNTSRSARYFNTHCLHIRHAPFSSTNYLALGAAGPIPAKIANQSVFPVKKYPYELTNGVSRELAQGLSLHCSLVACAHPAPERKQVLFHPIVGNRYGTSCGISTKRQVLPEEGHRRHQVLGHRDFRGLGQQRNVEIWLAHAGIMDTITPLFLSGYSANTSLDSLLVRTLLPIFTGSCSTVFDLIDYETEETCSSNSGKIRPQHPASNDLLTMELHHSCGQLMPSQELKPLFAIEVNSCDVQPLHITAEFEEFEGSIRILPVREFILPNTQDGVLVKETTCFDFILTSLLGDYANMELTQVSTRSVTDTHIAKPMLVSKFAVEIMFRHAQTADAVYPLTVGKENPIACFSSDVKPRNWIAAECECATGWSSAFTWNNETWLNYCKMTGYTRNLITNLGFSDIELTGHVTVIEDSISCSVQNYVNGKMKEQFSEVHNKCIISFHGQVAAQKQSLELGASLLIHGRPSVLTHEVLLAMEKAAEFPSVFQCACLAMNRYLECDTVKVTERLDVVATHLDKTAVSGASRAEAGCSLELVSGRILETTNLTSVCGTSRLKVGNEFTDAIFTELGVQFENQYTSDSGVTHKLYYLSELGVCADDDHTDSHFSTTLSSSNPAFKRCPMTKESNSPNEEHSVWSSFSQTYTSTYDDSMFRAPLSTDIFGSCTQVIRTNPIRINKNLSECERVEGAQNDRSVRYETNIEKLPMRIFGFGEHVQCPKMSSGEANLSVFGFVPCTQVLSQGVTFYQQLPRFNLNTALINAIIPNGDTILFYWSNFCPILVGQSKRSTPPANMLTGFENNAYLWQFASSSCNLIFTEERNFRLFSEVAVRVKCSGKIEVSELTVFWFYAQTVLQSVLSHVKESSYSAIKIVTPRFLKFKDPKRTDHLEDRHKEVPKLYTHVSSIISSTDDNLIQMIHEQQSLEIFLPSADTLCHVKRLLRPLTQMNALRFEMHIDSTMEEKDVLDLDASPEVPLGCSDVQRACLGDSSPRLEAINLLDASLVHDLLDGGDSLQMFEGSVLIAHMVGEYLEDFSLLHPEKDESTTPSISCILCQEKQLGFGIQIGGQREILTNSAYEYSVDFGNWQSEISVNPHSVSNLNFCDCITSLLVPCSLQSNPRSNTAPDCVTEESKLSQMVQIGHVSEQYMPLFPPQSSSNRLHLHTPRVTKLLRKALETPSNTQDAYHHPTVQTIQPLLKVHAFMQLIRNQLFPRQADSLRRQSMCAIRVCVLNTYTKEFECCSSHQAHHSTPATMNWICTILICSQFSQLAPHDQLQVEGEQSPGTQWLHLNGFGAITAVFRSTLCVYFGKTFNLVTTSNKWAYVASQEGTRSITMCKQPELVYRSPTGKAKHPIGIPEIKRKDSLSIRSSMQDTSLTLSIHQHDKRDYYRRHTCTKVSALNDGEHMVFRRGTTLGQTSKMKVSTEVPSRLTKKVSTYSNDRTTTPKDTDSPKHGMRMYEKKSSRRRWSTSPIRSTGSTIMSGCKHIGVQTVHDTQTRISGASSKSRSWVSGDMRELNGQLRVEEPPGEIQRKTPKLSDETTPYLEKLRQRVKRRHRSTSRTLSSLSAKESEITETDTSELAALRISPHTSHLLPVSYRRGSLPLGVNLNILRRGRDTVRQVTMKYNTTIPHVTGSSNPTLNPTTLRKRPGQRKDDGNDTIGNIAIRDRATLWASRIRVGQRLLGNNKLQSPLPATKMVHHSQPPPPTGSSNLKVSSLTRSPAKCDPPENTKKGYLHTTRFKTGVSAPAPIQPIVSPKRDANIPRRIPDKKQPLRSLDQTTVAQRPVSRTMRKEKLKHL